MAATEANAAPVVQEDGKTPESKPAEAEQPANNGNTNSETINSEVVDKDGTAGNSEVVDKDGTAVNSEVVDNKETVNNDTAAAAGAEDGDAAAPASDEAAAPPQNSENASSAEPKTSFLDSFLNKSGLGKVMGGRKKKEPITAVTAATGGEENAAEGGEKDGDKGGEEAAASEAGAEGGTDGEAEIEKAPENGEKEEEKKAEKGKPAEAKSTVRDLIRKPVARIFSHRSAEKKDVKVRSKSLDRLDPEALNAAADSTAEEGAAAEAAAGAGGADEGEEGEQKASSSSAATKHMKRWHSFKKLMAQKGHKKSVGEDVKEEDGEGGGDSSTLDSKESGQKRWKLKRSWTFQGLKRDPSMVGISGKAKGSDKDSADNAKPEEEVAAAVAAAAGEAEEGEEAKEEGGTEEAKAEGGEEKEKAEGGEEEKAAAAAGGGTVTQHANEIWTSFKKRVIHKSKRANTECAPCGEEDATAAAGEDGAAEEGKDAKAAKAKRSHFGRAVSLKNFILRKGKSTSVDMGEGAKEEEEEEGAAAEGGEGGEAAEEGAADGEAAGATEDTNDKDAAEAEKTSEAPETGGDADKEAAEKTPADVPVTNGENGCSNGTGEENATHNHQDDGDEDAGKTTGGSPVKKSKEAVGAKEEANAKIINTTAAVNSDKKAGNV
ncbi:apolipoprotein B receptor isoform X2 [Sander lucioperca]|uniref:apolipoprotein B receptor isoform X2 n=1 Tax=Sander lucioperca TaxID=283035 RepID=UPI0016539C64|nr:apolipoprotein B receptor isoform X2 [Sander lucioperca]